MTNKEANQLVVKLFNKWAREFTDYSAKPTDEFYKKQDDFKLECLRVHKIAGLYEVLTDKNVLKMASICSSIRFVEPHNMLMCIRKATKSYYL